MCVGVTECGRWGWFNVPKKRGCDDGFGKSPKYYINKSL
jgi:hypothetical protein